jgi:hypothetical protein
MEHTQHNETQQIELATAAAFFSLYNAQHQTTYAITGVAGDGEVPDVFANDDTGKQFNLEVTLTEDRPRALEAILGRSDSLSIGALKRHLDAVRAGTEKPRVNSLFDNALPMLLRRIDKKLRKRYGASTALVVRDTSPLWDWEPALPLIHQHFRGQTIPFDLGIWLLAFDKASILQLHAPSL